YIGEIFTDFIEFHGDRYYGDDEAIVSGIAFYNDEPITVIGHQRGKATKENIRRNFGMAHPEGFRKAIRHMKQAEKFDRPIVCFIDTKGAHQVRKLKSVDKVKQLLTIYLKCLAYKFR